MVAGDDGCYMEKPHLTTPTPAFPHLLKHPMYYLPTLGVPKALGPAFVPLWVPASIPHSMGPTGLGPSLHS